MSNAKLLEITCCGSYAIFAKDIILVRECDAIYYQLLIQLYSTKSFGPTAYFSNILLLIYSNKKEASDFHGSVSFDPAKMLQQK